MIQIAAFLMARFPNVQACPMGMELGEMLEQVGFDENEIGKTLLFLQLLEEHEYAITQAINPQPHSMRIYHPDELKYLSDDVLDFLQFLQKCICLRMTSLWTWPKRWLCWCCGRTI